MLVVATGSKVGEGGGGEEVDAGNAHVAMHAGRRPAANRRRCPDPSCSHTTLRWLPSLTSEERETRLQWRVARG
jgi:hypothetical protein